jgi:hypothetical protein
MGKRQPNQEVFEDDGKDLIFTADFGMLEELASIGRDPALIYADLSAGLMPPVDVRNVMAASGPEDLDIEDLINRYGLAECSMIARHMLSHAMIGDAGKSRALGQETTRALLDSLVTDREKALQNLNKRIEGQVADLWKRSRWKTFASHGLLWAAICLIFLGPACGIFRL